MIAMPIAYIKLFSTPTDKRSRDALYSRGVALVFILILAISMIILSNLAAKKRPAMNQSTKKNYVLLVWIIGTSFTVYAQNQAHSQGQKGVSSKTQLAKETYICPMHPNIKQHEMGSCPICGMDLVLLDSDDSLSEASISSSTVHDQHTHESMYTCPMHPNIRQDEQGSCPICGMDLVSLQSQPPSETAEESVKISKASRRLAGIETETVQKSIAYQSLQAVGSIDFDEGRISTITAFVDGRIETLFANYIGVQVKKNEHLAVFYSPTLYSAQIEYLQAQQALWKMRKSQLNSSISTQKALITNAEQKLKELGMSVEQIKDLKKNRKAKSRLVMDSSVSGTVIEKNAVEGSFVKAGQIIYKVADLSTVWLLLDMFPEEAAFLKFGLKVKASIRSAPNQEFTGRISFISPVINKKTRTVRVRVEIPNPKGILRPGDFASAIIRVPVGPDGLSTKIYDPELAGMYISPMHPQETSDKPGSCSVCGMELIAAKDFGYTADINKIQKVLTVARNAVLSVGEGHVVFVEREKNHFQLQKVVVGPVVERNRVVILDGLNIGDVVAARGVFLIDSQMQLSGKTSLMQISTERKPHQQEESSN